MCKPVAGSSGTTALMRLTHHGKARLAGQNTGWPGKLDFQINKNFFLKVSVLMLTKPKLTFSFNCFLGFSPHFK